MNEQFQVIGLSHQNCPVSIREQFYFSDEKIQQFLLQTSELFGIQEHFMLCTCNRTEYYFISEQNLFRELTRFLTLFAGLTISENDNLFFSIPKTEQTIDYFFEVAAGLHSKVIGDLQIATQIKQAYILANNLKFAGSFLHRLFHTVFHINKRIYQETSFRDGAASLSYAAADLIKQLLSTIPNSSILILGLGEMGSDVARNLSECNAKLVLCNRTKAKAEQLQQEIPQAE
ncbi:MAG: NAD(P)-binding domain-containing protein, partial [Bacteroidia bacterium]|nr:NAD(P)-binding domain-containing protein [Bacteroidia bacterium]